MTTVLFISYDGMTDFLGQSQVIPYILGLRSHNYDFVIISAEKKINYNNDKNLISNLLIKHHIAWKPVCYSKNPPVLSTLWDIFKIYVLAKKMQKRYRFDIVHCRSYIPSIIGLYLKRKFHVRFIFDMRGFYPDERVEGGLWNIEHFIYRKIYQYFKKKELQFLSGADQVICLTGKAKKIIETGEHFEGSKQVIEVIPCCADLNLFSPGSVSVNIVNDFKKLHGILQDDFIITYLGSTGTWYMVDEMLQFFRRLMLKKNNSKFLFITNDNKNDIFEASARLGIKSSGIIVTPVSRKDLPSILSIGRLSVFFIRPVFSKLASSPSKMGEILGMGIPVICNSQIGDIDEIIQNSGAGIVIENFTIRAYDDVIDKIDDLIAAPGEKIRTVAEDFFSLDKGIEKYSKVYEKLMTVN